MSPPPGDLPAVFSVAEASAARLPRPLAAPVARVVDAIAGLSTLQALYRRSQRLPDSSFVTRVLRVLAVVVDTTGDVAAIPVTGPLVVVANHPHGALDGLVLLGVIAARRADVRVLGNALLTRIPELASSVLPVDVFASSAPQTRRSLREAQRWLAAGGVLCVFPAGEVAGASRQGDDQEGHWHDTAVRLAARVGAPVVTCAIAADGRRRFRWARRVGGRARLALLPRMLLWSRGQRVRVHVHAPVRPAVARVARADLVQHLRSRTLPVTGAQARRDVDAIVARQLAPWLDARSLAETPRFAVCWFHGREAPLVLDAIGRAREVAFRAVGEGTGRAIDLDAFDEAYVHVCLWDRVEGRLAGAYRLGVLGELPQPHAPYTATLFDFTPRFFEALGSAIEVGRAFVAAPYQRQYAPLALLWAGIGRFVAARPHCRTLFGAVSLDREYGPAARQAMLTYLTQHAAASSLETCVVPKHPLGAGAGGTRLAWAGTFATADIATLDAVVARLDPHGRGVPVLLRQYLKLGARVAGASIDPAFSDVLDVLTVVDLPSAPPALLRRFMGAAHADAYLQHWAHVPRDVPRRRA